MLKRWILVLSLAVLAGCASEPADAPASEETPGEESTEETPAEDTPGDAPTPEADDSLTFGASESVVEQLDVPWSMVRTDEGWLISERGGTIAVIDADGNLDRQPVVL